MKQMTAIEIGKEIQEGKRSVKETVTYFLQQIEKKDSEIGGFLTVLSEEQLAKRIEEVEQKITSGEYTGPLAGVPVAIKDNICMKGVETTCGSKILQGFYPTYNAFAVERLEKAGAICIGKTNMDEFAMGSTTETSYYKVTKNPWDVRKVPGGSSGGSAAVVAAGEVPYALGSDTGGSIRQPSSFCGIVGLKPTYGRVSRNGLIAYGSSLDQIGPMAKSVEDVAYIFEALVGHDKKDGTSVKRSKESFVDALQEEVQGLRIGIPKDYFGEGLQEDVKEAVLKVADTLKEKGAQVELFDLGLVSYGVPAYYTIASAEASSNLSRFDGVKYGYRSAEGDGLHEMYKFTRSEGFGEEVKRRIMLGSFVLSAGYYDAYYLKALRVKHLIKESFDKAFLKYDLILGPVAPTTAMELGKSLQDPMQMYLGDIYTISANLAGLPGISVPAGLDHSGMPIGVQFMAKEFEEKKLFRAAYAWEQTQKMELSKKCLED